MADPHGRHELIQIMAAFVRPTFVPTPRLRPRVRARRARNRTRSGRAPELGTWLTGGPSSSQMTSEMSLRFETISLVVTLVSAGCSGSSQITEPPAPPSLVGPSAAPTAIASDAGGTQLKGKLSASIHYGNPAEPPPKANIPPIGSSTARCTPIPRSPTPG